MPVNCRPVAVVLGRPVWSRLDCWTYSENPMRSLSFFVVAAFACISANAAPHICWFDHPSQAPDGIALHFSPSANATLRIAPPGADPLDYTEYWLTDGVVYKQGSSAGVAGAAVDLVVQLGTKAYVIGGAHDVCELEVTRENGKLGVFLSAASRGSTATDFVPAE